MTIIHMNIQRHHLEGEPEITIKSKE